MTTNVSTSLARAKWRPAATTTMTPVAAKLMMSFRLITPTLEEETRESNTAEADMRSLVA